MDWVRTAYRTQMWLWGPDQPPVPVRWFFARPGAKMFPGPHNFDCVDWQCEKNDRGPFPPIDVRGAYDKGRDWVGYNGQNFHGRLGAFETGGIPGFDDELTTGADGAIPECRPPTMEQAGGEAIGGTLTQTVLGGMLPTGGEALGGSMLVRAVPYIPMSGGEKLGGAMPTGSGYALGMEGGEALGGSMLAGGGTPWTMSGGEKLGGAMPTGSGYALGMEGGEALGGSMPAGAVPLMILTSGEGEGGSMAMWSGLLLGQVGGEALGGAMDFAAGYAMALAAGESLGGSMEMGSMDAFNKVDAADTTFDYLRPKLEEGDRIALTVLNVGADEKIEIAVDFTSAPVLITEGGTGATSASAARTALGLAIGTDVQAHNGTLDSIAAGTWTGATSITTLGTVATGTWAGTDVAVAHGGTGAHDAPTARTNLGLAIGTDVQAYHTTLVSVTNNTYVGCTAITTVGTIVVGTWNGTAITAAYLPANLLYCSSGSASGTTTSAYVTVFTLTSTQGLHGCFDLKNTAGINQLHYRVNVTDMRGNSTTGTDTTLFAGSTTQFDLSTLIATSSKPPFTTVTLQVKDQSAGSHATYDSYRSVIG